MTTHYVDIRILPDPEFGQPMLLGALVAKLHRVLVHLESNDIGITFPGYSLSPKGLGEVLRLHSTDKALGRIMATEWLHGMRDHTVVGDIRVIPNNVQHCHLIRRQFKTNVDRLRRRRMRRKGETFEEATMAIPDEIERRPIYPYVHLRSQSTGQPFAMFLEKGEPMEKPMAGEFNTYGLSKTATLPWF